MAKDAPLVDLRYQTVTTQYIAMGDITVGSVSNITDMVDPLQKLQAAAKKAKSDKVISEDQAIETDYQLSKAISEITKPHPDKGKISTYLSSAASVVSDIGAMAGFAQALAQCIDKIRSLI